ncbi:bifunctional metallophosphatase/5'-nucleotidase [candidate division KSB1 bacterium]|nr:bifunctional metallophosphatase/5'-nucleotidase [candidate division KSB1 bacterium]
MKKTYWSMLCVTLLVLSLGCSGYSRKEKGAAAGSEVVKPAPNTIVKTTLLQINDVYEITPVGGGKEGGMARLATLRKQLAAQNPNMYMILAGDLFSPSALGTAKVEGERLDGKQMVAVLNAVGLNYCTFGNHEFDLKEQPFLQRLSESRFKWFSSNAFDKNGKAFPNVAENVVFTVANASNQRARVAMFGVTITKNNPDYVTYIDPLEAAKKQVQALREKADILIAVTHLTLDEDIELAQTMPEIDLILGGHEHENVQVWRGTDFTPIFKADANARSAYIHELIYDTEARRLQINSRLQPITDRIPDDPEVSQVVQHWDDLGLNAFRQMGFEPNKLVVNSSVALDGRESSVRNHPTQLTEIIVEGFLQATPDAELAIFNGGSVRIDDEIPPGPITEYDVIRILPFGGKVVSVEMRGRLLKQVLDQGQANKGSGGYLHATNAGWSEAQNNWLINGKPLDQRRNYKAALSDYLISGNEQGLSYLNRQNPDLRVLNDSVIEVRRALINQLRKTFASK